MKLYATVTSERASKGQGGNKFVYSQFTLERELIGEVELYLQEDGEWILQWRKDENHDWDTLRQGQIKGEKQKGECHINGCTNPQHEQYAKCQEHIKQSLDYLGL